MTRLDIQAIAFDKDGTLFDSERLYREALIHTCRVLDYTLPDSLHQQLPGLAAEATLSRLQRHFGDYFDRKQFIAQWIQQRDTLISEHGLPMMPQAAETIKKYHALGYPLALVTSDNYDGVLHDFNHADPTLLAHFSIIITVDDVSAAKPNPEPYIRAAAYLGVMPAQLLVVEDSEYGARAALDAGCPLALYPTSGTITPAISHRATRIIHCLSEIAHLLSPNMRDD